MISKQVLFRLSSHLLTQLDKLCENGIYKTRSEAISDAIRHLLERYRFDDEIGMITSMYLANSTKRTRKLKDMTVLSEDEWAEAEKSLMSNFGTTDTDKIFRKLRGGI